MMIMDFFSDADTPSIRALILGTCRLENTLPALEVEGKGKLLWRHTGFTHSIHDAVQALSFLLGKKNIPEEVYPLIFGDATVFLDNSQNSIKEGASLFPTIDMLIIELSTKHRVNSKNFDFNQNRIEDLIRMGGLDYLDWWSGVCRGKHPSKKEVGQLLVVSDSLKEYSTDFLHTLLTECKLTRNSEQEVVKAVSELNKKMGEVKLLVTTNGNPKNNNFASYMAIEASSTGDFRYYDPNSLIESMEKNLVFKGSGKDINHFEESFAPILANHFINFLFSNSISLHSSTDSDFICAKFNKGNLISLTENKLENISENLNQGKSNILILYPRMEHPSSSKSMGWFNFSFEASNTSILDADPIQLTDSFSKEHIIMYPEKGLDRVKFSTNLCLDLKSDFDFTLDISSDFFSKVGINFENLSLDYLGGGKLGAISRIHSSGLVIHPLVESASGDSFFEIEFTEHMDTTGGIFPQLLVKNLSYTNIDFVITAKCTNSKSEAITVRVFDGKKWINNLGIISPEFTDMEFSCVVDLSAKQKPRIGFRGVAPGTKIQFTSLSCSIDKKFDDGMGEGVLILTDREFFTPLTGKNNANTVVINNIIQILTGNGITVEVEEVIDCKTGTFHRSGEKTFDFALYISERSIESFWGGLDSDLHTKVSELYCLTELLMELKNSNSSALNTKDIFDFLTQKGILGNNQNGMTNHVNEHLIKELKNCMASENNLRSDMLIRVLLCNEHLDITKLLGCLDYHPRPEKIISRVLQVVSEQIEIPEIVNSFGDNNTLEEFDLGLVKIAALASEIENINSFFERAESLKELSRSLFLECKSSFSGSVMLNLAVEKKKFGSVPDAWIINNNWVEDMEILEQWTKISPNDEESWQVWSRVLWNKGMKLECSEVAEKGLEYHSQSVNLLRRKAHGLRIKGKHAEAVEIEKILLQSDKLSKVDTVIYLVRSLFALEEWEQVLEHAELGLKLNPELEEFHQKKLQAQENIQLNQD